MTNKSHWENVYETKTPEEVSWTQQKPQTSLELIRSLGSDKSVKIIDIGSGDSNLADFLLEEGYENITVLDISEKALERAKRRLGKDAEKIQWIVADITDFTPEETYDIWHDRAAFHFLTHSEDISKYVRIAEKAVSKNLIVGTFSKNGPKKCSGLEISQYDEESMNSIFENSFEKTDCITEDHITPFSTNQNFIFCTFKKK
ncbi:MULTISPECIES: class I SAM-dependent methyltransferase [unclassified Chryseobacterium]|uniref:class I SAM-dependent methyltransferase n=1 Tax=unclassified Chryseobacterium TaxID=2593645 RepID=UPI000D3BFEBF|nr:MULTISPECIES: class I SAM-dependent methyltransferase [unclassified Chryseobacterium]PTT72007.1 SAM-dependent methyltransferase [Chryseobacterium sp. HMWF001]PVV56200.1 class I SAM-dependent methyltransferase [Chryseobacterium sp. HMWF035]